MGVDQNEARRQRASDKPKRTVHPYVALEHRVIDSPAYAALGFAARNLLVLIARQLTRDNNGHLQATFAWCKRYGFGSEHTLRDAISDLVSHGFVFKTRSHGANGAWARYALTWIPIRKTDELYLENYRPFAYRDWFPIQMTNGKSSRLKVQEHSGRKCSFTPKLPAETADYETCCHGSEVTLHLARAPQRTGWIPLRISRHRDR
jgi:hypothetical protein